MLKWHVTYPSSTEELEILRRMTREEIQPIEEVVSPEEILRLRGTVRDIYMDEKIENYIVDIVCATREPAKYQLSSLGDLIEYGASPRATIYLSMAARAHAFLRHRGYVTPEDVHAVGMYVLRHRVIISYEAEAEGMTSEQIIERILGGIEVP